MQKKKWKKEKEKKVKKNGHKDVRGIENNGYKDARHEKKIAPALENISKFQERDMFSRSIVELG